MVKISLEKIDIIMRDREELFHRVIVVKLRHIDLTCTFKGCNENMHVHKAISIHRELSENCNSIKMLMLVCLIPFITGY